MFTHLNITTNVAFTAGEKITGGTSNATGTLENISTQTGANVTAITVANPGVATSTAHGLKEGQQIKFDAIVATVGGVAITTDDIFVVRNPSANEFELYLADGTTSANVDAYTSSGLALHGVVVVSNVNGTFIAGETITGGTSGLTANYSIRFYRI